MRPKILLVNDDGIDAPGLHILWDTLYKADFADLAIVAPAREHSGTGASLTWHKPILVKKVEWKQTPAWAIDGSPRDCIKIGLTKVLDHTPDLIISGINPGSNAGANIFHSGTVGAIIESMLRGIPGIAFSCENGDEPNYHVIQKYITRIVDYHRQFPPPVGSFLNVNCPHSEEIKGFRFTRQGKGHWGEDPTLHAHTEHGPAYFLGGKHNDVDEVEDCDTNLLKQGYMTIVPIHVLELTDRNELDQRKDHFENFFKLV